MPAVIIPQKIAQLFTLFNILKLTEEQVVKLYREFKETDEPDYWLGTADPLLEMATEPRLKRVEDALNGLHNIDDYIEELRVHRTEFWRK